jgi:hypothetical protein
MAALRRRNVLAACAFVALASAALFSFYGREPRYSGKSLSYWCDQLPFTDGLFYVARIPGIPVWGWPSFSKPATTPPESVKIASLEDFAFEAIDALGTNTAPGLLARLQTKPSRLEAEWAHLQLKFKLRPKNQLRSPIPVLRSQQQRTQALTAIVYLSHPCFIPELSRMTNSPDPWLSAASSYALSTIHQPLRSNLQRRAAIALRKSRFNQDWRLTGMTMSTPKYLAFQFKRKDAEGISGPQGFVFFDKDGANPTVRISN